MAAPPVRLAQRVQRVKPSFTLEMITRAAELKSQGVELIDFGVGEPDFNTHEHIREAAKQALDEGYTKYTAGAGMLELRQAICRKLKRENNLTFTPRQVLVSNGEKQSLSLACQALFQSGDQVLIFAPYWVSFPEFVSLADAQAVVVKTLPEKRFEPDFEDLENKITPRVRGVIMNSPSNPTGGVWSATAVKRLLDLAGQRGWVVISDECYERLVFEDSFTSAAALNGAGTELITCMSLSKTYAMTGWRIGYAVGNETIIKAMNKIQGQTSSCANSIGQRASIAALNGNQSVVEEMRQRFQRRRDLMVGLLNEIPGLSCPLPGGAFYAFPDITAYLGKRAAAAVSAKPIDDSFELCDYLLETARVVTIPGDGFGAPGHIRLSYTTDRASISTGLKRLAKALENLE